jgi:hypothetical protein
LKNPGPSASIVPEPSAIQLAAQKFRIDIMTEWISRFFGHVLKPESLTPGSSAVHVDQSLWGRSEKMICGIVPSQIFEKITNRRGMS